MDILDDLTNKFMDEMDSMLADNPKYKQASAEINAFCEQQSHRRQSRGNERSCRETVIGSFSHSIQKRHETRC
jgi:hypothetical protein